MTSMQMMRSQSSNWISSRYPILTHVVYRYRTFVRIGSGLSFADYVWIRAKPWKPWDRKSPPSFLQTASKSHDDKGDVYLEPEEQVTVIFNTSHLIDNVVFFLAHSSSRSKPLRLQ